MRGTSIYSILARLFQGPVFAVSPTRAFETSIPTPLKMVRLKRLGLIIVILDHGLTGLLILET